MSEMNTVRAGDVVRSAPSAQRRRLLGRSSARAPRRPLLLPARARRAPLALASLAVALLSVFALAPPALADTPPAVTIAAPSAVAFTSAALSGTVNPEGGPSETVWQFQFSTEPVLLGWTPVAEFQGAGAGSAAVPVESPVTGLAPNTTYFVRLVARNAEGAQESVTEAPYPSFTTKPVPAPVTTIAAPSEVTGTTAHFAGEVKPEGTDPAFNVSWHFQCSPECPGLTGGEIPADTAGHPVSVDATGLAPNTSYQVSLVASNGGGTATAGPESFATGAAAATVVFEAPSGISSSAASVNFALNPNGADTKYRVEYGLHTAYGLTVPVPDADAGAGTVPVPVSEALTGLHPGASYHYRVVATNSFGVTTSADQTFATEPAPAAPFVAHESSSSFGPGAGNGSFNVPAGVSVDPSSGDVYVADQRNNRVLKFDASGKPVAFTAGSGAGTNVLSGADTPAGGFFLPAGIAVDPATGDFYVTDAGNNVVDKFSAAGAYLLQLTGFSGGFGLSPNLAVDPTNGTVFVADPGAAAVDRFESSGTPLSPLTGFANPLAVAVDSDHQVYVVDNSGGGAQLLEFDPAGNPIAAPAPTSPPDGFAVDGSNGDLYVADGAGIEQFGFTGNHLYTFGSPGAYDVRNGVAVNPTTHVVYAASTTAAAVEIFTTFTLAAPVPLALAPTDVNRTGATLQSTVDPKGLATTFHFVYGTTVSYGSQTGSVTLPGALDNRAHEASAILSGSLQPATTYHYAVVASNSAGTVTGPDRTFETAAAQAPSATTGAASAVTQTTATISAVVNPNGLQSTYRLELGVSTAYGTPVSGSAGSEPVPQTVTASFASLQPATTYHYRVSATNADGTVYGADQTFTTSPGASPLPAGSQPAPILAGLAPEPPAGEPAGPPSSTHLTNAQRLRKALHACHAKKNRGRRASCERQARRRYGPAHRATHASARPATNNRGSK